MTDTDQEKREDAVLRRMLATKPTPHKPLAARKSAKAKGEARKGITRPRFEMCRDTLKRTAPSSTG